MVVVEHTVGVVEHTVGVVEHTVVVRHTVGVRTAVRGQVCFTPWELSNTRWL